MGIWLKPTVALLMLAGIAPPAAAVRTHVQWTGTVQSGIDTGVFLPSGGSLTGDRWSYDVTVDDSVDTYYKFDFPGQASYIYGGTAIGAGPGYESPVSAVLTINGVSAAPLGSFFGSETNQINFDPLYDHGLYSLIESDARSIDADGNVSYATVYRVDSGDPVVIPWDYHTTGRYVLGPDLRGRGGTIEIFQPGAGGATDHAFAYLIATSLTVGNVPDPASWALLMTGFGLCGVVLRVRRRGPILEAAEMR